MLSLPIAVEKVQRDRALTRDHWQLDPNFRTHTSGTRHGRFVPRCRDDASRTTDGLPSAADAPLQRSELAKSAIYGIMHRSKRACLTWLP